MKLSKVGTFELCKRDSSAVNGTVALAKPNAHFVCVPFKKEKKNELVPQGSFFSGILAIAF